MKRLSLEDIYESLVIQRIEEQEIPLEDKCSLLLDFHRNSTEYYEMLCEYTYLMTRHNNELLLWISLNGRPYLSVSAGQNSDILVMKPYSHKISNDKELISDIKFVLKNLARRHV